MKNILIVVDVQNDFIDGALGSPEAQATLPAICEKIAKFDPNGDIFVTMDTHGNDYLSTQEGKKLPIPHCILNTPGHMRPQCVQNVLSDRAAGYGIILKNTFGSLDLADAIMRKNNTTSGDGLTITLVGYCTDICVIANAIILKTKMPEANIVIDERCCAGVTLDKHLAALETMRSLQMNVY